MAFLEIILEGSEGLVSFFEVNVWVRIGLALASALLGVLVFPPFGAWWLSVFAWIPLLYAVRGTSIIAATRLGILHGAVFYGVTMSWVSSVFTASPWMLLPLAMLMAFFTGGFTAGACYAFKKERHFGVTVVLVAMWWVAVEFVRSEIYILKFPWMTPGVGLGPNFLSPLIGVYGISFCILVCGLLVLGRRGFKLFGVAGAAALVVATSFQSTRVVDEGDLHVLALQAEEVGHEEFIELASQAESGFDAIVFPEYSYGYDVRKVAPEFLDLCALSTRHGAVVVVGTKTFHEDGTWQNTALTLFGNEVLGTHYKNHTVHFFDDGVPGLEAKAIDTPKGRVGTPICFDNDYEDVVRKMTMDGAEYFLVPSMDAKHWTEREHWQHAELFRHRAAENARWMVVSSSSGVTQVLDIFGNRVKSHPIMEEGYLTCRIRGAKQLTIYSRLGWLFPWLCLVVACVWLLVMIYCGFVEDSKRQMDV